MIELEGELGFRIRCVKKPASRRADAGFRKCRQRKSAIECFECRLRRIGPFLAGFPLLFKRSGEKCPIAAQRAEGRYARLVAPKSLRAAEDA